jgi:hypothetical protein
MTARCSFGRWEGERESEWDGEGGESIGSEGQAGRLAKDCAGDSVGAQATLGSKKEIMGKSRKLRTTKVGRGRHRGIDVGDDVGDEGFGAGMRQQRHAFEDSGGAQTGFRSRIYISSSLSTARSRSSV